MNEDLYVLMRNHTLVKTACKLMFETMEGEGQGISYKERKTLIKELSRIESRLLNMLDIEEDKLAALKSENKEGRL